MFLVHTHPAQHSDSNRRRSSSFHYHQTSTHHPQSCHHQYFPACARGIALISLPFVLEFLLPHDNQPRIPIKPFGFHQTIAFFGLRASWYPNLNRPDYLSEVSRARYSTGVQAQKIARRGKVQCNGIPPSNSDVIVVIECRRCTRKYVCILIEEVSEIV